METRANYALIGAFVLVAAAAVLGFVLWLGATQLNRDYAAYDIVFQGPVTLEEGASVRYIGIKVGEVESVRIDRRDASRVRARIRIDRSTPIKTDSTASIDIAGITGVTFVQINAGSEEAGPIQPPPYQDIPVIQSVPTPLDEFFASGSEIAGRAGQVLDQSTKLLSDENIAQLGSLIENADSILSTVAVEDEQILRDVRQTLQSLQRAGDELSVAATATTQIAQSSEGEIAAVSAELRLVLAELKTATASANSGFEEGEAALASARELIEGPTVATMNETRAAAQDLRVLIARLDRIARDLETNPQGFVVGTPRPYEEAR